MPDEPRAPGYQRTVIGADDLDSIVADGGRVSEREEASRALRWLPGGVHLDRNGSPILLRKPGPASRARSDLVELTLRARGFQQERSRR
jgi:hypothetical protein